MVFTIIRYISWFFTYCIIGIAYWNNCNSLLSIFFDKTVFKYYREKKSEPVILIVVSIGVMFILNAIVRIVIGPGDVIFMDGARFIIKAGEFKKSNGTK